MTPAEIAAIVQRSDLQSCACGSDVRALAAECERLQAFEAATADASSRSARAKATMYANMRIEIESLHAQLEAVTRERDRYKAALSELADIVQGHLDDGDKLDTFTIQPVREALKTTEES